MPTNHSTSSISIVNSLIDDVRRFLNEPIRNRYVSDKSGVCVIYVRKANHMINGTMHQTFDIANMSVDESMRGQGIGTSIIDAITNTVPYSTIFIESLLNESFHQRLLKDGWLPVTNSCPPCVFKTTKGRTND